MKLLLIIALFVTVNGMAQEPSFDLPPKIVGIVKVLNSSSLKPGTVVLDENNVGAMRNATFSEELLFLLQDYEKECYNDSTEFKAAVYISENDEKFIGNRPDPWESMINYVKDTVVMHHKEPTFTGLIEWLKENNHRK